MDIPEIPLSSSLPPAPGQGATRTVETETMYLRRALAFEARTARELSITNPSPQVIAAHALEQREEWMKASWRQVRAALVFRFKAMGTQQAAEAVEMLLNGHQSLCATESRNTSGRRAKHIAAADLQLLLSAIGANGSKYATLLTTWLTLGAVLGLRPHEWGQSAIVHMTPAEVGDDRAEFATPAPYLRVFNSKFTNGRAHGECRHLNLSALGPKMVHDVSEFVSLMVEITTAGGYQRCYSACVRLLHRVNSALHGSDDKQWIQLYSARHKFSSDAKHALDVTGVAAIMGHGSSKTASRHYGRRQSTSGDLGPKPVAAEIARVRNVHQRRSAQPAALPTPASPVVGASNT